MEVRRWAVLAWVAMAGCGSGGTSGADSGTPATDVGATANGDSGATPAGASTITGTVNGETLTVDVMSARVDSPGGVTRTLLSGRKLIGTAQVYFQIDFPGSAPGSFSCAAGVALPRVQFQKLGGGGNRTSDTTLGGTCQVDVTEVGATGAAIRGTFTARTTNGTGTVEILSGSFNAVRQN